MIGLGQGKRIAIIAAAGFCFALLAPAAKAQTADPCAPNPYPDSSQRSTMTVQPVAANKQARWQRMGRNVEILLEDPTADINSPVRVCFAWKLAGTGEEHFTPALVATVDNLDGGKKGLKITAVVPDLGAPNSPYPSAGLPAGVYSENGSYAIADIRVFYAAIEGAKPAEPAKPAKPAKDGQPAKAAEAAKAAEPGKSVPAYKLATFGVISGNVVCDYPFPTTTAGSGMLTISDRKNWQPANGEIEFSVKVPPGVTIPNDTIVKVCFRWKLADGSNKGPFHDSDSTHIVNATADTLKIAAIIPDLKDQPPRMLKDDARQPEGHIRGQYAITRIAVPLADMRVILFNTDGYPIADVVSSIGITSFVLALFLVILALGAAYWALRLAWHTRLEGLPKAGPLLCLVTSRNGVASLSQFQVMLWTFVVLASAVYVISLSGELVAITSGTLVLLGISGASGVVAKVKSENDAAADPPSPTLAAAQLDVEKATELVQSAKQRLAEKSGTDDEKDAAAALKEAQAKLDAANSAADAAAAKAKAVQANVAAALTDKSQAPADQAKNLQQLQDDAAAATQKAAKDAAFAEAAKRRRHPLWSDLVMEESLGREIDVSRVQMLFFTVVTAFFVLLRVATSFTIPEIPEGFLILMGISNSVYVGSKFATNPNAT